MKLVQWDWKLDILKEALWFPWPWLPYRDEDIGRMIELTERLRHMILRAQILRRAAR